MLNTSVWRGIEHIEHQRVTQNLTCWTKACDAELNMLNKSVWRRTEHVEENRVTRNWTCWTKACDAELNMLNTSVWLRTERVEHQNSHIIPLACIYVGNMKQFYLMKTDVWLFLRRLEQCSKVTTVPWTNHFERHPSLCAHRTPRRFYPFSGSKFRDSIIVRVSPKPC